MAHKLYNKSVMTFKNRKSLFKKDLKKNPQKYEHEFHKGQRILLYSKDTYIPGKITNIRYHDKQMLFKIEYDNLPGISEVTRELLVPYKTKWGWRVMIFFDNLLGR